MEKCVEMRGIGDNKHKTNQSPVGSRFFRNSNFNVREINAMFARCNRAIMLKPGKQNNGLGSYVKDKVEVNNNVVSGCPM